ncbi:arsenate reductase ArsC [Chitinibacter bivalviorum]|uniref:Arsenate reductase ArsC n=1 Tax=Chitinibacter bivalviorum TaxID=2739434 RepID=A0A7H9BMM7_9NEIS|nr:arsenate reductase ArsC [Chitinibacter bivalviorum]QLG88624.1 arsenate reductase ArsC [Chitinibacter bivalviorum]
MKDFYNVLFICTENSARSQMAEAMLNQIGYGVFRAFSAGSQPSGTVHPMALAALEHAGISTANLRSKSWSEFTAPDAPHMDLVFTLCDKAAGETCPPWPGVPTIAHWSMPHPGQEGDEAERQHSFNQTLIQLRHRLDLLVALPFEKLDHLALKQHVADIGQTQTQE